MDFETLLNILSLIFMAVFGGLALWFKGNGTLSSLAAGFIAEAEALYKDVTNSGGEKFNWVVERLYGVLPSALRPFIPKSLVESVVQSTFDAIERYAKLQLDKLTEGIAGAAQDAEGAGGADGGDAGGENFAGAESAVSGMTGKDAAAAATPQSGTDVEGAKNGD